MVKSEELMLGDWVKVKLTQEDTQVTNMDSCSVYTKTVFPLRYEEIEPIPLTPGILEKNGFMNIEGDFYLRFGDYKIVFDKHNDPFVMKEFDSNGFLYEVPILEVTYIHELQHFLRLCGIEKEIIL